MNSKFRTYILLVIIAIHNLCSNAQNSIQVTNYSKAEYNGGNQNWDISIGDKGDVFVANNNGLLIFDGAQWVLNQLPGQTIIRSVACDYNRIYTGSFEEFGYWLKDSTNLSLPKWIPRQNFL